MSERILHCWKDKQEWAEETFGRYSDEYVSAWEHNCTCMLPAGHDGPHKWTPDDGIVVEFKDKK
jgi:hypothetical protein